MAKKKSSSQKAPAKKSENQEPKEPNKSVEQEEKVDLTALEKKNQELVDWMLKHPQEVIKNRQALQERIIKKRCIFGDTPLPTTLIPIFLKKESLQLIEKVSVILDRVLNKTIDLYFTEESVREYFPYSEIPRAWVEADPGYQSPTLINRHDALFDGKDLKFIEFNTDNPGGKGWVDTYEEVFFEQPMYQDIIKNFGRPLKRRILQGYHDTIMQAFEQMNFSDKPRVALVDFREISLRTENEILRDFFIENGIEANLIDARDLEYRKGRLYSNQVPFNILVRALKAQFYLRFPREMRDFIQGVTNQAACMVNSFRAILGSEKSILSFLTNPFHHHHFTKEEVEAIKNHIPWTRKLDETITISPDGEEVDLKNFLKLNQQRLVLKPSWGAGGYNVKVGASCDKGEWEAAVAEAIGCPWWTVQEKVPIPESSFPVIKGNKVVMENRYINLSPYVFGGKYVGILGRTSGKNVINVSSQGGVIPVFPVKGA